MTIAKVTNSQAGGPWKIAKEAYLEYRDAELGSEEVRGLELLSISGGSRILKRGVPVCT